jgi:SPP1 family predicted phage head-tail adaptor
MSVKLAIGKMDRRITIQQLTQGIGADYGEPTQTWSDWATVWANVYYGGGREFEQARQVNAEISAQFQIQYCSGLLQTMRILYDGKYFDIDHFDEVGRKNRWNIWAKARRQ